MFTFLCQHTHRSLLLHHSLVLAFVHLCSQMDEHQHVRPNTGTTELNHSYYTGNSLSALHSSQQFHDDTVSTSVHPLVSTQETNGTTSSGSASGPQLPHDPISSPVLGERGREENGRRRQEQGARKEGEEGGSKAVEVETCWVTVKKKIRAEETARTRRGEPEVRR